MFGCYVEKMVLRVIALRRKGIPDVTLQIMPNVILLYLKLNHKYPRDKLSTSFTEILRIQFKVTEFLPWSNKSTFFVQICRHLDGNSKLFLNTASFYIYLKSKIKIHDFFLVKGRKSSTNLSKIVTYQLPLRGSRD